MTCIVLAWVDSGGVMYQRTGDRRGLLTEEMLRYFGETCFALAARCHAAGRLPAFARREAIERLQNFAALTKKANLELSGARAKVVSHQIPEDFLFDRALASIEHLGEVADETTQRIDVLLSGLAGRK